MGHTATIIIYYNIRLVDSLLKANDINHDGMDELYFTMSVNNNKTLGLFFLNQVIVSL